MKYWGAYKTNLSKTILGQQNPEKKLSYYKNQLFYYIIVYSIVFSPLAIGPGIVASYRTGFMDLLVLNITAFMVLLVLGFIKPLSIQTRKILLISLLLVISWSLLFNLKLEGPGLLYLFTVTIVSCLVHSSRIAYYIIALNSIMLVLLGLNIHFEWISSIFVLEQSMTEWFGIVSNLIFLSIIIVAFFEIMFRKLDRIIVEQGVLNEKVNSDNLKMHEVQEDLKGKNEELSQFAHTIAHDLKEPLRSMQAFSQLIITNHQESIPKKGQEYLQHIKSSAERMRQLLDALLEYSQLGRGTQAAAFSVTELIQEIQNDLTQLIEENHARIKYDTLPQIKAYELEFKQLIQNLLTNAIKFKKDDRSITVTIKVNEQAEFWEFIVSDNGIGIDAKNTDKIFTIFHRLHKNKFPGTGLGLANCKKIVEMHGGEIWVESTLGKGSDFHFTISKTL